MINTTTAQALKDHSAPDLNDERLSRYAVVDFHGERAMLFKDEVEAVQDWTDEDAVLVSGGATHFTHMVRWNARKAKWLVVRTWGREGQHFAMYADESANVRL